MAGNLVSDGTTVDLPIGTAYTGGSLYSLSAGVGSICGVALDTVATGAVGSFALTGVWDLTKTAAANTAFDIGDVVYATTGAGALVALNSTTAADIMVGTAMETVTTTATSVKVLLNVGQKIA